MDPRRLYSALVFIPLLYVGIRYSPPWLFSLLISAVSLFALWEFLSLYFSGSDSMPMKTLSCFSAGLLLLAMHEGLPQILLLGLLGFVASVLAGFFMSPIIMKQRIPHWMAYLFGVFYVGLLLGHYALLRNLEHGVELVFFVIIVTWLSDTGGFFIGKPLGKHPLAPTLSPKKSIEGLLGGIAFSVIGAIISQFTYVPFFSLSQCVMLGVSLALLGALGDLAESAIKRSVHVKDSGTIIPGHGGVLDRVDSLLFTGPAMYYYVMFSLST